MISTSVNALNAPVWVEKFEIKIGKTRSAEGMTETVMETMVVDFDAYQSHGNYFTSTESGTYYLGVHCVSDYDQGFLAVNQIKVSSPNAVALPTDVEYEEVPLIESNFSNVGGSWDAPIDIVDSSKLYMNEYYALIGLEGWHGQYVKAAGDCLIIKRINGDQDQQAKIVPPLTKAEGFETVRISMDLKVKEHSARSTGYNKLEFFEGDFMVGTSELDNAWRWYDTDVSLDDYPLNANEWKTISQLVPMPTESKNLWGYDDAGNSISVGSYLPNQITTRIDSYHGSDIAVKNYKVVGLRPAVHAPKDVKFSNYDETGFDMSWTASDNADTHIVCVYSTIYSVFASPLPYNLTREQIIETNGNTMHINFPTDKCVVVEVYGIKDGKRSPSSGYYAIFDVSTPVLESAVKNNDGTVALTWSNTERATTLDLTAREGEKVAVANSNYTIASLDMFTLPDEDPNGNLPFSRYFDTPNYWMLFGQSYVQGGEMVVNNGPSSWGYSGFSIQSPFFDFTPLNSDVRFTVNAKTNDGTGSLYLIVHGYDPEQHGYVTLYKSEEQAMSTEYKDYTFTCPSTYKDVIIAIGSTGYGIYYVKNFSVNAGIDAGATFYRPYSEGGLNLEETPVTTANLPAPATALSEYVMRAVRTEHNEYTTYTLVRSPFSNTVRLDTGSGVDTIGSDVEEGEAIYYNFHGQRVVDPEAGVYIRMINGNPTKVVIK